MDKELMSNSPGIPGRVLTIFIIGEMFYSG
jgi:hypothetical protein